MVAQQHGIAEKEAVANKGVALDATKPPVVPQDPLKEKKVLPYNEDSSNNSPSACQG